MTCKHMNTLENYYIQHFHHNNTIIQEQAHAGSNPLFQHTVTWHLHLTSWTDTHSPWHNQSLLNHHTVHMLVHRYVLITTYVHIIIILNIYTEHFNFNFNCQHATRLLNGGEYANYTLDECTQCCITYSVTVHPEDGQAKPKHVGATNWENIYNLCILLVFH
jgi:hypothetical protein